MHRQVDHSATFCYAIHLEIAGNFCKEQAEKQMPNIKSAAKRVRQDARRRQRNRTYRSAARTAVKQARTLIEDADPAAQDAVHTAIVALDRAAQRGAIHANNAARRKSRLMQRFNKATAT